MGKQFDESIINDVLSLREQGLTNREVGNKYGLSMEQVKRLLYRYGRKKRNIQAGIVIGPKGRPRKGNELTNEQKKDNEIKKLKMENELLRSFLQESGRM